MVREYKYIIKNILLYATYYRSLTNFSHIKSTFKT